MQNVKNKYKFWSSEEFSLDCTTPESNNNESATNSRIIYGNGRFERTACMFGLLCVDT